MRIPKEATALRILGTIGGVILVPIVINAATLVYNMGVINTKMEVIDQRLIASSKREDKTADKIDSIKRNIGVIKMDVNGLDIRLKNSQKDLERVARDVSLTRSQSISTGRDVKDLQEDLEFLPPAVIDEELE